MATEEKTQVSQAHMDKRFDEMGGYIDTAVETLTEEMDRRFKEVGGEIAAVRGEMDRRFKEVRGDIKALDSKLDTIISRLRSMEGKLP